MVYALPTAVSAHILTIVGSLGFFICSGGDYLVSQLDSIILSPL